MEPAVPPASKLRLWLGGGEKKLGRICIISWNKKYDQEKKNAYTGTIMCIFQLCCYSSPTLHVVGFVVLVVICCFCCCCYLLLLSQRRLEAQSEEVRAALARVGDVGDIRQRARVSYIRCVLSQHVLTHHVSMQYSSHNNSPLRLARYITTRHMCVRFVFVVFFR